VVVEYLLDLSSNLFIPTSIVEVFIISIKYQDLGKFDRNVLISKICELDIFKKNKIGI